MCVCVSVCVRVYTARAQHARDVCALLFRRSRSSSQYKNNKLSVESTQERDRAREIFGYYIMRACVCESSSPLSLSLSFLAVCALAADLTHLALPSLVQPPQFFFHVARPKGRPGFYCPAFFLCPPIRFCVWPPLLCRACCCVLSLFAVSCARRRRRLSFEPMI